MDSILCVHILTLNHQNMAVFLIVDMLYNILVYKSIPKDWFVKKMYAVILC